MNVSRTNSSRLEAGRDMVHCNRILRLLLLNRSKDKLAITFIFIATGKIQLVKSMGVSLNDVFLLRLCSALNSASKFKINCKHLYWDIKELIKEQSGLHNRPENYRRIIESVDKNDIDGS